MYSKKQFITHTSTAVILSCLLLLIESYLVRIKPEFVADDRQLAEQEIEKLHRRFNLGDFNAIYNHEAMGLKQAISKKDFLSFLNNVHREFGNFKSIIDKRINVVLGNPVQLRAVCNSQFDTGVLTEMFIFLKDGDQIQLAQYNIAKGPAKLPETGR
jgi:hypothetical protein